MSDLEKTSLLEEIENSQGFFGDFGGQFIPETIRPTMDELAGAFERYRNDETFLDELNQAFKEFTGRPTALTPLDRISNRLGGARLVLKNEGLNLTGAHKINHCLGQVLLAKRMGKKRIIAETGAGQHGYATATVCARYGLDCTIYMGRKDFERQRPNVFWMEMLGAKVVPVESGDQTLNDAVIAAFKDLISDPEESFYLLGSAVGPHPYPKMNAHFQQVVGEEIKLECLDRYGKLPSAVLACVGGGSNALGAFLPFLDDGVDLVAVEAGGRGNSPGEHAAKGAHGKLGVFEGYHSLFLQDDEGNISSTHSISAGLDYCGMSPILAHLGKKGRVNFTTATNAETLDALQVLAREEGIIIALESAHAVAEALKLAPSLSPEDYIVINGSGRGEKDLFITMDALQPDALKAYAKNILES